ncbi:RluA family pseudouridine synthase [Bacillus luteolus]|uniref:Pseudouridine synthase n=1 Tax=Litchfieldia luteola TaxID=682179 RepID=A0ABR9QLL2_9BACI|nr:RluA family pseudouridine synthase [Cytobacillus luteolus]MBE4909400.1 RluA family pseudouridine synthase [Cytobacillus luteolus]MBP1940799.1 23S rRNA pseudouridine1911/1915/1917 synthase [Cytobacillus luteolus]
MNNFVLEWTITEESNGILIKDFLKEKHISKAALTDIKFDGGDIIVNGLTVTVRYALRTGDYLSVVFPYESPSKELVSEPIPLNIVYEDKYILIVNKPAVISTIPSREHPRGSLANALKYYYESIELASTIHIVNRLDRDTSGLLIVAKHRHVHHLFSEQQKKGEIFRRYEAVVHRVIQKDSGRIIAPIGRKSDSIIEREVREDGQFAATNYNVLKRYDNHTHISLKLETGRTHQIRVHMAYLGHPLLGDTLYGGLRDHITRQALHCCEVRFLHPILQEEMKFEIDLPDDMKELLKE